MADKLEDGTTVSLKALVHKGSNKVIFVECVSDFLDVLFSFLTFPMGTIKLGSKQSVESVPVQIGCMNNLYASVGNIDVQRFNNEVCRHKLLSPRNADESRCKDIKLKIDNGEFTKYFLCPDWNCLGVSEDEYLLSQYKGNLLSMYKGTRCENCGKCMDREYHLSSPSHADKYNGIYVKGLARLIVTDDLQVLPPLSGTSFSFLSKLGVTDGDITEETFNIGVSEVLNLLICSFVSKTPLTETLLKHKAEPDFITEISDHIFLTIPLGFILKQMQNSSWKGCIDQLYKSVQDLGDEQCLNSNDLLNPRIFPGFSYENHLLGIEEGSEASYYYAYCRPNGVEDVLVTDKTLIPSQVRYTFHLKLMNDKSSEGFLKGPTMFTITDKLIVRPISPIFGFSILNELKVPLDDIKEEIVRVGKEEVLRVLVASIAGDSALTDAFIRQPKEQ
ncbi:hypothetical protein ACLB2K_021771 [Fragaria x ananassa]